MAAQMFPATPHPNPSTGKVDEAEASVFYALRDNLPATWMVMHSVRDIDIEENYEADFVILVPYKGVLVLEVKSHRSAIVKDGVWYEWDINKGGRKPMNHGSPLEQAFLASKQFVSRRKKDGTFNDWGADKWSPREWKDRLRYVCGAVLVNMAGLPEGGDVLSTPSLKRVISPIEHYICGLDQLKSPDLPRRLEAFFGFDERGNRWHRKWFTQKAMEAIREKVKQNFILGADAELVRIRQRLAAERASVLLEATAESTTDVTVKGCAGSGKTVMLRREARRLYEEAVARDTPVRILILCFNKALNEENQRHFTDCFTSEKLPTGKEAKQTVDVCTFHSFARKECKSLGIHDELPTAGEKSAADVDAAFKKLVIKLRDYLLQHKAPAHYDHIFVDEAQDFLKVWFACLKFYGDSNPDKNWRRGRIYYFCDSNQTLYSGAGDIPRTSMVMSLKHNLRNSRQIALFNSRSLTGIREEERPIPMESCYGKDVVIEEEAGVEARSQKLHELVNRLLENEKVHAQDIVVLSPYTPNHKRNSFGTIGQKVRARTIRAFKGLEADHVIITDIAPEEKDTKNQSFNDFYVAATRAKFALYLLPAPGGKVQLQAWLKEAEALEAEAKAQDDY